MARMSLGHAEAGDYAAMPRPASALYELGLRYCTGRNAEQDLVQAHKWFNLAAMQGSADARRYRAEISREMSADQVAAAQREARAWLNTH